MYRIYWIVTVAEPFFPSDDAVISTLDPLPVSNVVTNPVLLTVARSGALETHDTVRPVSTLPWLSLRVAVSGTVAPAVTTGAEA